MYSYESLTYTHINISIGTHLFILVGTRDLQEIQFKSRTFSVK